MGYSGYSKEQLDEWNMEGGIDLNPDMTEIYANDKRLQQLLKKQSQYEKYSKKWHNFEKIIAFRKKNLEFRGSSSEQKVKKNQVAQGYFDQDTKKAYINNKEVSFEEYLKFQGMTKTDQLINYGEDADKVEIKKDKKGIKDVLTSLDQIEEVNEEEKKLIDESLGKKNEDGTPTGVTEENIPPIESDKPNPKPKFPPVIIQHPECGHLTMGDEKDKDVTRPRDIGLYGGSANALRLFKDGGFELRSSDDDSEQERLGSTILQACKDGKLLIKSLGDLHIDVAGEFSVSANKIKMEALNASEDGINLKAKHDIRINADNNIIITGDNITIDAKERIVSHSEGWQILIGQCIRLHEPQTKLCPAPLRSYIDEQIKTLKG